MPGLGPKIDAWKLVFRRKVAFIGFAAGLALLAAAAMQRPDNPPPSVRKQVDLFGALAVHEIRIKVAPQDIMSLRDKPRKYIRGKVQIDGGAFATAGLHLKGSLGSFQPIDEKPSFTLDFTRAHAPPFFEVEKIHLNNSAEDPSFMNELLGGELFRAADIPTPRVSYARLELNGKKLGLYVLKEGFTRAFAQQSFGHATSFEENEERVEKIESTGKLSDLVDLERFVSFVAMEILICHRDGYSLAKNNFRVYHHPETKRATFLPAGMDQLFGKADYPCAPRMAGSAAQALARSDAGPESIRRRMRELLPAAKPERLNARIDGALSVLRNSLSRTDFYPIESAAAELKTKIRERYFFARDYLEKQKAGTKLANL